MRVLLLLCLIERFFGYITKASLLLDQSTYDIGVDVTTQYMLRDATTALGSPFLTSQRSLPAVKVDNKGAVYTTRILKQQLANELKLPLRDLRVVDPSYPSQIQACFTARPGSILFSIENIKVVLKCDEALIFSPNREEVQEFIPG